ncbi:MAG: MBL fold metallo-hydrolase [Candidatus Heimdallarchaeota archaeon]
MLKITAYGAAKEVGRSCILVEDKNRKILLDCGIKINHKAPSSAPEGLEACIEELSGVIISHAHMDHSGYVPGLFGRNYQGKVHMTTPTKDLATILWHDHLKIEGERHFNAEHVALALDHIDTHSYEDKFKVSDGVTATFYDAGHILGSAMILLEWDGTSLLYTGDFNTQPTIWHDPARHPTEEVDVVITEATNAIRPIPPRKDVIPILTRTILRAIARKSKVLIPSFAVGRSQEIQVVIATGFEDMIQTYVDGMILDVNKIYKRYFFPEWVSPHILQWSAERSLSTPFDHEMLIPIRKQNGPKEATRYELMKSASPNIVITTSGMLEGGPIHSYLRYRGTDPKTLLTLVGYQVEDTIGRLLLNGERSITLTSPDGIKTVIQLNAQVETFNFSSHAPPEGLRSNISQLDPQMVFIVHCQPDAGEVLRDCLHQERTVYLLTMQEPIDVT